MDETYVFLDLETTGLNPETDEIIEIGALAAAGGEIIDRFSTLVKPSRQLPLKIGRLTGITDEMLQDAPGLEEVTGPLLDFLGSRPIVGHHISFDLTFLTWKLNRQIENVFLDTMDLVQVALPQAASYRLETVKSLLGIAGGVSHRALADAETAWHIFLKCLDLLRNLDHRVLEQIDQIIRNREWNFSRVLSCHLTRPFPAFTSRKSTSPYAYLNLAQDDGESLFPRAELTARPVREPVEMATLAGFLALSGPFAQKFPQYKFRSGQVEMLQTVARGFQEGKHMVIESGTGTGKSLAYLLPAAAWAVSRQTKVVIATHTINLQEQLWNKDLPGLQETTGLDFTAALVKGRNNYLCLRRWEARLKDSGLMDQGETIFCLKVLVWLTGTVTGDKSELNLLPGQNQFWTEVSSDQDSCLGSACPWYHNRCFVTRARRQAETADLLVVNHSLLLADLKTQSRLLPAHEYLIIDEAHHLEDSATEQLGWTVRINSLKLLLLSLNRGFGTGFRPGLFNQIKQAVKSSAGLFNQADCEQVNRLVDEAGARLVKLSESVTEIEDFLLTWSAWAGEGNNENNYLSVRVRSSHRGHELWEVFSSSRENYSVRTVSLVESLRKISRFFASPAREQQKQFLALAKDIEFQSKILDEINGQLNLFCHGADDYVYWVEIKREPKPEVKIRSAPVSVGQLLRSNLFQAKTSILLTSATLSVDGTFEYFMERVGLSLVAEDKVIRCLLASPFVYEQQSLLCIVRDLPDPTAVRDSDYVEEICPVIEKIACIFNGKTLVLFTSHKMLRDVYTRVEPELEGAGLVLLGHRIDGGRTRLLEEFKRSERAVLFGASSFWEGIDLPGSILKCVVIVRLPFASPGTPIIEARVEELVNQKKNAFYNYTVPEAVIKFKQGFGRLIRTEEDDGVVVVLDRRIVDRKYGRRFLNSLPIKTHFRGDVNTVLQKMTDWGQGERPPDSSLTVLDKLADLEKYLQTIAGKKNR